MINGLTSVQVPAGHGTGLPLTAAASTADRGRHRCREPHTSCQLPLLSTLFHIKTDVKNSNVSRCPSCVSECHYRHAGQRAVTMTTAVWLLPHPQPQWVGQRAAAATSTFTTFTYTVQNSTRHHGQFGVYTEGLKRETSHKRFENNFEKT